ncbi:MAG: hypothetical protein C0501_19815 [Isosphaera sp.]|nr:hypothetical protein [Isosphaera sp.]
MKFLMGDRRQPRGPGGTLTREQAAASLGVTSALLRRLHEAGVVFAGKVGRVYAYRPADIPAIREKLVALGLVRRPVSRGRAAALLRDRLEDEGRPAVRRALQVLLAALAPPDAPSSEEGPCRGPCGGGGTRAEVGGPKVQGKAIRPGLTT